MSNSETGEEGGPLCRINPGFSQRRRTSLRRVPSILPKEEDLSAQSSLLISQRRRTSLRNSVPLIPRLYPRVYTSHTQVIPKEYTSHTRVVPKVYLSHTRVVPKVYLSYPRWYRGTPLIPQVVQEYTSHTRVVYTRVL